MTRIYISGPMSGLPGLNKPAFNAEAARLRALGYDVVNPAEVELPEGATWEEYMRADIALLLGCDSITVLPGWEKSRGAGIEFRLARDLGLAVV